MGNGCPVCGGIGKLLATAFNGVPISMPCVECAGLMIPPASVDDDELLITLSKKTQKEGAAA